MLVLRHLISCGHPDAPWTGLRSIATCIMGFRLMVMKEEIDR